MFGIICKEDNLAIDNDTRDKKEWKKLNTTYGEVTYEKGLESQIENYMGFLEKYAPNYLFGKITVSSKGINIFYEEIKSEIVFKHLFSFKKWKNILNDFPPNIVLLDDYILTKYPFYNGVFFIKNNTLTRKSVPVLNNFRDIFEISSTIKASIDDDTVYRVVADFMNHGSYESFDVILDDYGVPVRVIEYVSITSNGKLENRFLWYCIIK